MDKKVIARWIFWGLLVSVIGTGAFVGTLLVLDRYYDRQGQGKESAPDHNNTTKEEEEEEERCVVMTCNNGEHVMMSEDWCRAARATLALEGGADRVPFCLRQEDNGDSTLIFRDGRTITIGEIQTHRLDSAQPDDE